MIRSRSIVGAVIACSASLSMAQSAQITLATAGGNSVTPGQTVTITVQSDYDTAAAPSGVFGAPGFYGFGGTVTATGMAAATASSPATDAQLTSGATAQVLTGSDLVRAAAGRGLAGGLADDPAALLTFDLLIDAGASAGDTITLDFDGAVVLVLGDTLTTFATDPGAGQMTLTTAPLVLTVSGGACALADITVTGACTPGLGDGVIDLSDFSCYLSQWSSNAPIADITTTGTCTPGVGGDGGDLSDFSCFLSEWSAGCP